MKQKYCLLFVGFYLSFLAILLNSSVIFAQSNSVSPLGLSSVGSSSVPTNIIFLETNELRPTFKGSASANSSVTVEIEGNKNTTKAGSDGQWEWAPLQDLKLGELELKISSGAQSKLFRLKVLSSSKALDSGKLSATREASPESSPRSIFEQDQVAVSQPTSSPVTPTSAPSEEGFLSTLQNYLPFILGAFAIGILLFIVSRLLKPKPSASSMPEPAPPTPSPEVTPTPTPASENIPPPGNPQTPPTWQPPAPETIATPTAPVEPPPTSSTEQPLPQSNSAPAGQPPTISQTPPETTPST